MIDSGARHGRDAGGSWLVCLVVCVKQRKVVDEAVPSRRAESQLSKRRRIDMKQNTTPATSPLDDQKPSGAALETIQLHRQPAPLTFVSDWSSPFTQRTWMALQHRNIPYQYVEASDEDKLADSIAHHPIHRLPAFHLKDLVVRGSVNLIEYLEDAYPDHEPHLQSKDPATRARERMWTDYIRRSIVPPFARILRAKSIRPKPQIELCQALNTYVSEVEGPFFSGEQISLPDICLATFVARARMMPSLRVDAVASALWHTYANALMQLPCLRQTMPASGEVPELRGPDPVMEPQPMTRLPIEITSYIMDILGDFELATTLRIPHSVPPSAPWREQATPLDRAILTGSLNETKQAYEEGHRLMTSWGSRVMLRFGYTHILQWCLDTEPAQLHQLCDYLLPEVASAWGRVSVLNWAIESGFGFPQHLSAGPLDEASRNGHVDVLEWWRRSQLPLVYSEHALNSATIKKQIEALEWWRTSGLCLEIGNVLDFASMEGSTEVLDWWANSGLEGKFSKTALYHVSCTGNIVVLDWWRDSGLSLVYDKDVLLGATKHGRVESLTWWLESGLPIYFTFFDIEEALEDCVAGERKVAVEEWWADRGLVDQNAGDWTRTRMLGK